MNMINEKGKWNILKAMYLRGYISMVKGEGYDDDALIKKDWFIKEIKRLIGIILKGIMLME